jgi:N-acetylmuramoyl-L-alanine amidase
VLVGDEPLLLTREPTMRRGELLLPADFVTRALSLLLGREISLGPDGEVLPPAARSALTWQGSSLLVHAADARLSRQGRGVQLELPGRIAPPAGDTPPGVEVQLVSGQEGSTAFRLRPDPGWGALPHRQGGQLVVQLVREEELAGPALPGEVEEPVVEPEPTPRDVVVLDPGHGGAERGAVGPDGTQEKDVVLAIALELAYRLQEAGIDVQLTRTEDREVPIHQRTEFANQQRASLFVSIHANASASRVPRGSETFFLSGAATEEPSRAVVAYESGTLGVPRRRAVPGALEMTLWDMAQTRHLEESEGLATRIQHELNSLAGTPDRGVRQGPFSVLMGATMPAVLVEVGFLSNPAEEVKLKDPAHRARLAEALARAIRAFFAGRPMPADETAVEEP